MRMVQGASLYVTLTMQSSRCSVDTEERISHDTCCVLDADDAGQPQRSRAVY